VNKHSKLCSSHDEYKLLKDQGLPAAEAAYREIERLYGLGKAGYQDLLDTRRELIDMKTALVDAAAGLIAAKAEIEQIIGGPLEDLK